MKTNPGGMLEILDIVGRDELIQQIWEVLDKQSVVLTAERRIGKTSIIRKMENKPKVVGTQSGRTWKKSGVRMSSR